MQTLEQVTCPYCGQINDRSDDLCEVDLQDESELDVECQHCQKNFSYLATIQIFVKPRVRSDEIDWESLNPQIKALRYESGEWYAYNRIDKKKGSFDMWSIWAIQLAWPVASLSEYHKDNPLHGRSQGECLYDAREEHKVVEWCNRTLMLRPR